jgi:hypothetical protein
MAKDKAALNNFRAKQWLPFEAFLDVEETNDGEEKPFLLCAYNLENKAYRSPWTKKHYLIKVTEDGEAEDVDIFEKEIPEDELEIRAIEKAANEVWNVYTQMYYGHEGVGSVFLKARGDKGSFEGIFGVHKRTETNGSWDSVHIVQVEEPNETDKTCEYRVESAVVVSLDPYEESNVSCSLTKESSKTCKVRFSSVIGSHLENLGTLIEAVEIDFRSRMERVDIPKTLEVTQSIYKKQRDSSTAYMFGKEEGDEKSMAAGLGIGAGMIGEIANKAKSRQMGGGGPNPFMNAMQANLKKREATMKDAEDQNDHYTDLKKTLKKSPNPMAGEAMAALKKKEANSGSGYTDPKAGLKKKTAVPKSPPPANHSPTPEFMNFRNKLKKHGAK